MPLALDGPWAKLKRAAEHLDALDSGCRLFLQTKPYYVTAEYESEAGYHVVRFRQRQAVPLALGIVVGDLVHSLRSALDQAVWLIACRSNPVEVLWQDDKIARTIAFPFADDPDEFKARKVMQYIADDAKAVLDRAQPYQRTERAKALAAVNRLWNIDKHRVIHGAYAVAGFADVRFVPRAVVIEQLADVRVERLFPDDLPVRDGMRIAHAFFGPLPENVDPSHYPPAHATKLDVKGEPTARLRFGATGGGASFDMEGFARLIDHTAETLSEIAALPEHPPA